MSDQSRLAISAAFKKLETSIYPADARLFRSTTLKDVQEAAKVVQRDQETRQCIRNLRRIKPLFAALERLGTAVETLCQGTPYLCFIWAPLKLILTIGNEYIAGFEKLVDAYGHIAQHLPRLDRLSEAFLDNEEFQSVISDVLGDLLDFHLHAYKFLRRGGWRHLFDASWKSFSPQFDGILENLRRNRDLVDKEANSHDIAEARRARKLLLSDIEHRTVQRRDQQLFATLNWLDLKGRDCDQENRFDEYNAKRKEGTCEWVLEHPKVRSWLDEDDHRPYLWLKGKPGAGKTTIATHIIRNSQIPPNAAILYCLCTYDLSKESKNFCSFMLRLLIIQILRLKSELIPYVYEEVAKGSNPTLARLRSLFQTILSSLDLVYLVVDGLDECDRTAQKETLQELLDVPVTDTSSQHHRLKILFCSRETEDIIRKLRKKPFISLSAEQESLSKDIVAYTKARLSSLRDDYEDDLVDDLEQHIITKSHGMFLWAKLVVDLAFEQRSVRDLQNVVLQTSPGLDGIYASILDRLNSCTGEQLRKVRSILGWVAFAFRPLKTFEVCDALVFEDDDSTLDSTTKLLKSVLDISKPLIEEKDDQTIVLVHFSAREYLLNKKSGPYLPAWSTNARITASSLRYLSTCTVFLAEHDGRDAKLQVLKGFHDLFPYVHEFWIQHCFAVTSKNPTSIADRQLFLALHHLLYNFSSHWAVRTAISSQDAQQSTFHIPLYANSDEIEEVVLTMSAAISHSTDLPTAKVTFRKRHTDLDPNAPTLQRGSTQVTSDQHASSYRKLWKTFSCFQHNFEQLLESSKNDILTELNQLGIKNSDIEAFYSRHKSLPYRCKFRGCTSSMFGSTEERARHELSHSPNLKCSDPACDLADHAFTRQSLRRHIAKYHQHTTDPIFPEFRSDESGAMALQKKQLHKKRAIAAIQKTPQGHTQQDTSLPYDFDRETYEIQLKLLEEQRKRRLARGMEERSR